MCLEHPLDKKDVRDAEAEELERHPKEVTRMTGSLRPPQPKA